MEGFLKTNNDSGNQYEFEDDNDSDLEGRLYAEIYFSNENREIEENFQDNCMLTIQDIKNASRSCLPSTPSTSELKANPSPKSIQNSITPEDESVKSKDQSPQSLDKNLNLEKQTNLEATIDITPNRVCDDEISNKSPNLPQKTPKSPRSKSEMKKDSKNNSPILKNGQKQSKSRNSCDSPAKVNSPVPKSAKRKCKNDDDCENPRKRRSLECNGSVQAESDSQLHPVVLNSRTSSNLPTISDGAMDILFPEGWKEKETEKVDEKSSKGKKRKFLKSNQQNKDVIEKKQLIQPEKQEIIEIFSDSSEDSFFSEIPKLKNRNEEKNDKQVPICLDSSSDSEDSIVEVPVPKKPPPPLVKVKDSDTNSSDSDDGIYDLNFMPTEKKFQRKVDDDEPSAEGNTKDNFKSSPKNDTMKNSEVDFEAENSPTRGSSKSSNPAIKSSDKSEKNLINDSQSSVVNSICSDIEVESIASNSVKSSINNSQSSAKENSSSNSDMFENSDENNSVCSDGEELIKSNSEKSSNNNSQSSKNDASTESDENYSVCSDQDDESIKSNSETSFLNNSQSSAKENSSVNSDDNFDCTFDESMDSDENNSICTDEEDDEPNFILNCVVTKSTSTLIKFQGMEKSAAVEVEGETGTHSREYFEPLNDNPQPSTSKVDKNRSYRSSKEKTDDEYFFEPMLESIKAFYDNEKFTLLHEFSIEQIRSKMSQNPKHWAILDDDSRPSFRRQRYFLNSAKCTLCRQSGHLRANCPDRKKSPICHMCGSKGHYETRCPVKVCLTCGKKQHSYRKTCEACAKLSCSLCGSKGHQKETCPDLWRQYHHTTNHSEHKPPANMKEVMKPSHRLICCNCTKWGHESFNCPKYRWTDHYPTPAHVRNYSRDENSQTSIEVINLDELEASSQSSMKNNETENSENVENVSSKFENSTTPGKNSNTIRNSNTPIKNSKKSIKNTFVSLRKPRLDNQKLIFECEVENPPRIRLPLDEFNRKHKQRIWLSEMKNANVKEIIAGRTSFAFLKCLSKNLKCDIYITVAENSKVLMSVTFYAMFSNRDLFRKIINLWTQMSDMEKQTVMKQIPRDSVTVRNLFQVEFDKLNTNTKSVEDCYNYLKETSMWLKQNENQTNSQEFQKKKESMISIRNLLVTLLYKHSCGVEKKAFSNMKNAFKKLKKKGRVAYHLYTSLYYYYHLIFANYLPTNLLKMLSTYFILNAKEVDVSLDQLVFNENQEMKQTAENSSPNKMSSLSEIDLTTPPKNLEQKRNVFSFPDADYIPISTSDNDTMISFKQRDVNYFRNSVQNTPGRQRFKLPSPNVTPTSSREYGPINRRENERNSQDFERNTVHNSRTNKEKKSTRKFRKLKKEATLCMKEALDLNIPEVTKEAIKVGDLINHTKLQRKHVNLLKRLIVTHVKKSLRKHSIGKPSKKRSFPNF